MSSFNQPQDRQSLLRYALFSWPSLVATSGCGKNGCKRTNQSVLLGLPVGQRPPPSARDGNTGASQAGDGVNSTQAGGYARLNVKYGVITRYSANDRVLGFCSPCFGIITNDGHNIYTFLGMRRKHAGQMAIIYSGTTWTSFHSVFRTRVILNKK